MKIVFMGTPDFAVPSIKALYDAGHEIQAVFCQPDKPKGRGYKLVPPPVKVFALDKDIPIYQPKSLKNGGEEFIKVIEDFAPDCIVVAAYGKILPKAVLDIPRLGCVNVHGSLLPKYRGAGPIQWAVLNDEKTTGITTMLMGEGLDTGDMLLKSETEIGENETAAELFDRLADMGAELIVETLDKLEKGEITPVPQNEEEATYAPMLTKELSPIDFSKSARAVHKQICGLSDWPCATTTIGGKRIKVYRSEIVAGSTDKSAGTVVNAKDLTVACGDGMVKLTEIQAEGSKRMATADYLRGKPVTEGTVLGE
ncbi:methionyl-tRNA formyltransferase [uncultured Ruminococcus sp.]|uniref:methionyl-tRNA formyltransferase n=1 Tax=uncultured Ruminococcus sp. TaxID=165186 RepID=UPI000EBC99D1|nr:methionyl-tRNA formyltransferase [uncultured Ruminococcus sp.]HCJ40937.1 methionyl-tRNA formyltransferase [Ruminococcus sp.]